MVYSWTVRLPDETKIADAYQMLKKQGEPLHKSQNKSNQQDKGQSSFWLKFLILVMAACTVFYFRHIEAYEDI